MPEMEIPSFLRRTQPKDIIMTAPAPAAPTKTRQPRKGAYIARVVIKIPLNMANSESLGSAIKAVADIAVTLPEGSTVEHTAEPRFGKM